MDGWKALVMIVAIIGLVGLAVYIFNEVKDAKIMQAKAEAVGNMIKGTGDMFSGFVPGNRR